MIDLDFEKLEDGRWYVVLPEYEGPHEDLEMVEGADLMLDALTTDNMFVSIRIAEEQPAEDGFFTIEMENHDDYGAFYNVRGCDLFEGNIWLCNVTHFVFGEHPELLYMKVL